MLLLPPCIPLLSSAAAAATAAARLAQRSVLAVASRPERWCQPRRAAPQKRVSFTLLFLRKSVVLTSTMSSKHSYARSGERGEKREDGQQGERKSGERRGTWGKESEQTIRQNTGDGRGDPTGTRGEGKERRGERRAKREQSRTERRQVRGEKREKVRRRRRAPRDDLRERTEKVAKVVSHVNEMAEQKTDRSDLTAVTCPCRFAASLAAFAALAWLDFTMLIFGGILQVTSGSTGPPCVAGVTSHTVATQLRMMPAASK